MIYCIADDGFGRQVAVGPNGLIMTSDDGGASWITRVSGVTNALHGVAFGYVLATPKWCAVGENGVILVSPDGSTWTPAAPFTGVTLYSVAWGGVFIAVGAGGALGVSATLGATWEAKSSGTLEDLFAITVGEGLYTIIGANDTVIIGSFATLDKEVLVAEVVRASLVDESVGTFSHGITAAVRSDDGYGWHHIAGGTLVETAGGEVQIENLDAGIGAYDYGSNMTGNFGHVIAEGASLLTTFLGSAIYQKSITSAFSSTGSAAQSALVYQLIADGVVSSESFTFVNDSSVVEGISMGSVVLNAGAFNHSVTQGLAIRAALIGGWAELCNEGFSATGTAEQRQEAVMIVAERMVASGVFTNILLAQQVLSVSVAMAEVYESGKGAEVSDAAAIAGAISSRATMLAASVEAATFSDLTQTVGVLSLPLTEGARFNADASVNQVLRELIEAGISFALSFGMDDKTYSGWVMNTRTGAVSTYSEFPFNSFAKIGGKYYGANSAGLYLLEGDTQAGAEIDAELVLGSFDFTGTPDTMMEDCHLEIKNSGRVILSVKTDDKKDRQYEVIDTSDNVRDRRVKVKRGIKSLYWTFSLKNIDGAGFELRSIDPVPVVLKRR